MPASPRPLTPSWIGQHPWEEVFFAQLAHGNRALWLRWTVCSDPVRPTVRTWAILTRGEQVEAWIDDAPGEWPPGLHGDHIDLQVGPLHATLDLRGGVATHRHVPEAIARLGRTYVPEVLDARFEGTISAHGSDTVRVAGWRGVIGHLYGRTNRVAAWAWCHANRFAGQDAVFELLSAHLLHPRVPALSSMVLWAAGRSWSFSGAAQLVRNRATFTAPELVFSATSGTARLHGRATWDGPVAALAYAGRHASWRCQNGATSTIDLHLEDPSLPAPLHLEGRAFLEVGRRGEAGPVLVTG